MARKNKHPHHEYKIFVEVLQNGELLSKVAKPFRKPGVIKLTSNPNGELTAPFYPLATDVDLVKITKRGAEVDLDPNWEGFTTFEGRIEDISSHRRTHYTHIMKQGDYGSIAYNDLRVLIRIGKERPQRLKSTGPSGEYRGSLFKFWFSNALEYKTLGIGLLAAAWIFTGIVVGLMKRPDTRPKSLAELQPVYTLPFIYPKHIELIPEAMQQHLNRRNLVSSVFSYYNNFTLTVLGKLDHPPAMIFDSSYQFYKKIMDNQKNRIETLKRRQAEIDVRYLEDKYRPMVYIPAVMGETLDQKLLRLKNKIAVAHQNFELNLKLRRETTGQFHRDKNYSFEQYQAVTRLDRPKKYTPWKMSRDEQAMYDEASEMAHFAALQQQDMRKQREQFLDSAKEPPRPITIAPENQKISYISSHSLGVLSDKISRIKASTFDLRKAGMVKEPLLGEINPKIISRVVNSNRFDLQLCFELALRRNQNLSGAMEWQWRLDSRGKISDIELLSSSIKDRKMIRCIRSKIASWKFPRPRRGSVEIRHPFFFNPAKG